MLAVIHFSLYPSNKKDKNSTTCTTKLIVSLLYLYKNTKEWQSSNAQMQLKAFRFIITAIENH